MQLTPIASNMTEVETSKARVLFSYRTPVAAYVFGRGYVKTEKWYSVTTKSRLNAILEEFASGCRVIQRDFEWFLSDFGTLKPFVDGMKV